ncbi:MAG: tetratricopeptide repeat protein [Planctomycetes bacterium]|nr:tetratricopeptide repeat protein [Planctomycetota bacterium]
MSEWFDAEEHADRALEMYERGRWAEAEAELRKALSLNPHQGEWHFNLGLTLEAAGREAEALTCYERTISLLPGQIDPLMAAGIVANRLGQFDRAVELLQDALRTDPQCEAAYAHLIESHLRLGAHDEAETAFYLAQHALPESSAHCLATMAESLMQRAAYDRAEWCLREALRLDPTIPRLRARLGAVYTATGRHRRALQMYLRDLRNDPGNIDTLLDFGELLVEMGRMPEAAEKFRRVLELEPANVDAHDRLGGIALRAGRYEQAHLEFELVFRLDPEFPQIRLSLGEVLLRRGRVEEAGRHLIEQLDLLRAATGEDEHHTDLPQFGALLLEAGLSAEAGIVFEQAISRDDQDVQLWLNLARARFRAGDREAGAAASRRVVRLDGRCIVAIHNLALAALEEGRLRLAAGWIAFLAMRSLDEHNIEVIITLALVTVAYAVAQKIHVSGLIAVVVAGLLIGNHGVRLAMSDKTREHINTFWSLIDEILNSILFMLIGFEVIAISFAPNILTAAVLAIPLALAARFVAVAVPVSILRLRLAFSPGAIPILTWGGLRGGISVALALSLPPTSEREILLAATYAVVIFSIIVQGLTMARVVRRYESA